MVQVEQAVCQMDEGTQQNAALVHDGASTAAELSGQAQLLASIDTYKFQRSELVAGRGDLKFNPGGRGLTVTPVPIQK